MKMADEKDMHAICKKCGKSFNKDEQGADSEQLYCSRCMIEIAEQYVPEKVELSRLKRIRKSRVGVTFLWIILFVCIFIIAIHVPKLISAFTKEEKSIRYGTYSTDAQTDQCINNLWQISKVLQEGKLPGKDVVCPASKKPYVMETIAGDIVVRCGNPELHGLKEMRVSKRSPRPEIKNENVEK